MERRLAYEFSWFFSVLPYNCQGNRSINPPFSSVQILSNPYSPIIIGIPFDHISMA
jgi:hypothetical protein